MPITNERPRLLVTKGDLPGLKARAAAGDAGWQAVLADANAALADPNRYGGTLLIHNLALTYLMTGDALYADRAIGLAMTQVNGGPTSWARDSGFDSRDRLPAIAVCYDWCYPRIPALQRAAMLGYMEGFVDWIWAGSVPVPGAPPEARKRQEDYEWGRLTPEALEGYQKLRENPSGLAGFLLPTGAYSVKEPAGNYFWGHWLGTIFTCLAGSGDSPLTDQLFSIATQKLGMIQEYQQGPAAGGYIHEGTSYGQGGMLRNLFLGYGAMKTAIPGMEPFGEWARQAMVLKAAMTTPDMKGVVPFGDQASDTKALFSDVSRMGGLLYQKFAAQNVSAALVRDWLTAITPNTRRYYWDNWATFLYSYPVIPPVVKNIARSFAVGTGYSMVRFGDVQHHWRCGTNQGDHNDLAAGEIATVRNGDWLIGLARQTSHSGIERTAEFCNCITVGGRGQSVRNLVDQSLLPATTTYESGEDYVLRVGEAGATYTIPSSSQLLPLLRRWRRTDLPIANPSVRIVWDQVEPIDPTAVTRLHINYPTRIVASSGNSFDHTIGASRVRTTALLPAGYAEVELKLGPPGSPTVTSYRVDQLVIGTAQFLNVYQFGLASLMLPVSGNELRLRVGPLEVGMTAPTLPAAWDTDATEFLYLGMAPGQAVRVMDGASVFDVTTSPAGVLRFAGREVGMRRVMLFDGVLPPPPGPTLQDAADSLSRFADMVTDISFDLGVVVGQLDDLVKDMDAEAKRFEDAS